MTPRMLAELKGAVQGLFDAGVSVAAVDAGQPQPALFPAEVAALANAIPARQREFAAGRQAARLAMAGLHHAPQPIPAGPDRAPIWPAGMSGSISHAGDLCLAAVGEPDQALGLDVEKADPLTEEAEATICSEGEISGTRGLDLELRSLLIFCAKEAAYKAQYPLTRTLFDFQTLAIATNGAPNTFKATFRRPIGPFATGDSLPGRWALVAGHLVTAVTIRLNAPERNIACPR